MSGDGSIYRRTRTRPNGETYTRWVAQASFGGRADRRIVRRVCRTRAEAKVALDELLAPEDLSRQPLGSYLRSWLADSVSGSLAPATVDAYRAAIASWDAISDIPLAELREEDVEAALAKIPARRWKQKKATIASPKTRRNALGLLRAALRMAQDRGHVRRNVAANVKPPRIPRADRVTMTPALAAAILDATKDDRYAAAYALAMCALRLGEVLGLAWSDLDLDEGVAYLRYQLVGSGPTAIRAQLKTAGSEVPVRLPAFAVQKLREHRAAQRAERPVAPIDGDGLVFTTPAGYGVNGPTLTVRFQDILEAAGLPRLRIHDLRHGAASLLAAENVHPRIIQSYLRHTTARMSLEVYTHTTRAQDREAADALDKAIGRAT